MYKLLNLAKLHCERLQLTFHPVLPEPIRESVLAESHSHSEGGIARMAVYGSTYRRDNLPYAIRAEVRRVNDQCHVEFEYMQRDMPRPPRSFKSVRRLAQAVLTQPQRVEVECDAYFVYHEDSGWRSALEIPQSIPHDAEQPLFTHIEALRLANRPEKGGGYSVQIRRGKSGELRHWVSLSLSAELSDELPQTLLDETARLSRILIRPTDEQHHGS